MLAGVECTAAPKAPVACRRAQRTVQARAPHARGQNDPQGHARKGSGDYGPGSSSQPAPHGLIFGIPVLAEGAPHPAPGGLHNLRSIQES